MPGQKDKNIQNAEAFITNPHVSEMIVQNQTASGNGFVFYYSHLLTQFHLSQSNCELRESSLKMVNNQFGLSKQMVNFFFFPQKSKINYDSFFVVPVEKVDSKYMFFLPCLTKTCL